MAAEFDERMMQRLKAFQLHQGLSGDGVAGPTTWTKLVAGAHGRSADTSQHTDTSHADASLDGGGGVASKAGGGGNASAAGPISQDIKTDDPGSLVDGAAQNAEPLNVRNGTFEWQVKTPAPADGSPGGSKFAESFVRFKAFRAYPRDFRVEFRVWVPMRNRLGDVSDDLATAAAIKSSIVAGKDLEKWLKLQDPEGIVPTSMVEAAFIRFMQAVMKVHIDGAQVTRIDGPA